MHPLTNCARADGGGGIWFPGDGARIGAVGDGDPLGLAAAR